MSETEPRGEGYIGKHKKPVKKKGKNKSKR